MKKLLVYLKDYIRESILGPLFKLLEALFELFVPLVIAAIIDTGIENGDTGYIIKMCLILVLLGFVGLAFSITAQYFAAKASVGFVSKIRHVLFGHIQSLSYSELDQIGTSTLITRMTSDMNQVQNGMNLALRLLLRSPFVVFGAMIMAFTIDVPSAMIFVYVTIVLLIVVFGIMLGSIPLYKKVQQKLDAVMTVTRENLTGVRVIRAFCKEDEETDDFINKNNELTASQKFVGKISALMNPVTYVIINLAIIWLIHTGAVSVNEGILTQGAVVALYNYMSQILVELIKLANLIINITKNGSVEFQSFCHVYRHQHNAGKDLFLINIHQMNRNLLFEQGVQLICLFLALADNADGSKPFSEVFSGQLDDTLCHFVSVVTLFEKRRLFVAVEAFHIGTIMQESTGKFVDFIRTTESLV